MLSGVMAAASLWVKECGGVGGNEKKRAGRSQVADVTDKAREAEPQKWERFREKNMEKNIDTMRKELYDTRETGSLHSRLL